MSVSVFAMAAHPDDIEFGMAGTLFLLKRAGCDIHYMNVATGSGGSTKLDAPTISAIRTDEARSAARYLGAAFYPPLVPDLEVFYDRATLARLASAVRAAAPDILLVPSPQDYMEDHMNTSRLAVTAAFCRNIPNFTVDPSREIVTNDVAIYHAQPVGNRDPLNQLVLPDLFVNIEDVIDDKVAMLSQHASQQEWLDSTLGDL